MFTSGLSWAVTFGILGVLGLSIANHRGTAALSAAAGAGVMLLGATCGLVGHPVSSWGLDTVVAGGIVAASAMVMVRR